MRFNDPKASFEARVSPEPNTGCWLWVGACASHPSRPRPQLRSGGKTLYAHKLSALWFGVTSEYTQQVNHTCHQTLCVNPQHLRRGTQADNVDDMKKAGRGWWQLGFKNYLPGANKKLGKKVGGFK